MKERAVLITGPSGSGKSRLALGMIALGAGLVADDQVFLARREDQLIASPPPRIAGLIEARGVGLLRVPPVGPCPVQLVVDLERAPAARLPQRQQITLLGIQVELIFGRKVPALEAILMVWMQNGREPL